MLQAILINSIKTIKMNKNKLNFKMILSPISKSKRIFFQSKTFLLLLAVITFCGKSFCQVNSIKELKINKIKLDSLITQAKHANSKSLFVYFKGEKVFGEYFDKDSSPQDAMSVTKSVSSLAIGKLITDGLLSSVDEPVYKYYPEWKQGLKEKITIRHLLNHTSGIDNPDYTQGVYPFSDYIQLALTSDITGKTDSTFFYNNKAVNLLAGIVQKISGERMDRYIARTIFKPLGITKVYWQTDAYLYSSINLDKVDTTLLSKGNPPVMAELFINGEDLLKIGILVLNKGIWEGKKIISEEYFKEALTPSKRNPNCGLLWWLVSDAKTKEPVLYHANGYLGNFIIIIPKLNLVVVRTMTQDRWKSEKDDFGSIYSLVSKIVE
jgi:CubicO group peptidase (beta-lactamase class C family)